MCRSGALVNVRSFIEATKGRGALLGLDVGRLRCGIAISDSRQSSAAALRVIPLGAKPSDGAIWHFLPLIWVVEAETSVRGCTLGAKMAKILARVERDFGTQGVVVGWPLEKEGQVGQACQNVLKFVQAIQKAQLVKGPLTFWDERYTSVRARRHAYKARKKKTTNALLQKEDAIAAALILQSYLSEAVWEGGLELDDPEDEDEYT
eukprot:scaffold228_cov312-Pinguiococcus_pyrenoidosus.AAC.16